MSDVDESSVVVISNKELVFLLAIFIFILVQLYPKNVLQKIIEDDHSNYGLTMVYLKDLLKHNPNDAMLNLVYLKKKMQVRDINISIPLANRLMHSKKKFVKNQATLFAFQAYMIEYFKLKESKKKAKIYKKICRLFSTIYAKKLYDKKNPQEWYSNAVFVKNDRAKYYFLKQLLKKNEKNVPYLRSAYFLALKLGYKKDANRYMHALLRYDTKNQLQWIIAEYNALLYYKRYNEAELILEANANKYLEIKEKLADFYLMRSMYKDASKTYIALSKEMKNRAEKEHYIKKAIRTLQWGNLLDSAAKLAHNYEDLYLNNSQMRQFILKIYLAAGRLDLADRYSKKILHQRGIF